MKCKSGYTNRDIGRSLPFRTDYRLQLNVCYWNDVFFSSYITSLRYLADTQNNLTHMLVPAASVLTHVITIPPSSRFIQRKNKFA